MQFGESEVSSYKQPELNQKVAGQRSLAFVALAALVQPACFQVFFSILHQNYCLWYLIVLQIEIRLTSQGPICSLPFLALITS